MARWGSMVVKLNAVNEKRCEIKSKAMRRHCEVKLDAGYGADESTYGKFPIFQKILYKQSGSIVSKYSTYQL